MLKGKTTVLRMGPSALISKGREAVEESNGFNCFER